VIQSVLLSKTDSRMLFTYAYLSLSQDVKPTLDVSDASLSVRPAMSNSINAVDVVQDTVSSINLIVTPPVSFDIAIQNTMNVQRDYTYVSDDITKLAAFFADPKSLDEGNALIDERLSTLPESFPAVDFDDEFIPSIEDADKSLFIPESVVVLDEMVLILLVVMFISVMQPRLN
jgi:hypothetical protein